MFLHLWKRLKHSGAHNFLWCIDRKLTDREASWLRIDRLPVWLRSDELLCKKVSRCAAAGLHGDDGVMDNEHTGDGSGKVERGRKMQFTESKWSSGERYKGLYRVSFQRFKTANSYLGWNGWRWWTIFAIVPVSCVRRGNHIEYTFFYRYQSRWPWSFWRRLGQSSPSGERCTVWPWASGGPHRPYR